MAQKRIIKLAMKWLNRGCCTLDSHVTNHISNICFCGVPQRRGLCAYERGGRTIDCSVWILVLQKTLADMKTLLERTDEWMRRRIRMVFWKKWKRVRTRYRNLRKLGLNHNDAFMTANNRKGYWAVVNTRTVKTALSNQKLEKAGFQVFLPYYKSVVA